VCPHTRMQTGNADGNEKIRCVVAHSYGLLREGLRRLLHDQADLEVVAEAVNSAEMIKLVSEHRPHVVIADTRTLGLTGPDAERLIRKASPQTRVVFLNQDEEYPARPGRIGGPVQQNLAQQASSWQSSPLQVSAEQLITMVRSAAAERSPAVCEMPRLGRSSTQALTPRKQVLTTREREVLKLLAEGRTVRSAALVLGLSAKTVDAHKFNLMRKLGVHNKVDLVMSAIQMGVLKMPANF
jgi:two-component system, NarL family, response regulator NreC